MKYYWLRGKTKKGKYFYYLGKEYGDFVNILVKANNSDEALTIAHNRFCGVIFTVYDYDVSLKDFIPTVEERGIFFI